MITIEISEKCMNRAQMVDCLRAIADQIENGNTRGYDPDWNLLVENEFYEEVG